jgi:DNA repair exonuclease SbcCD ATPase subunit
MDIDQAVKRVQWIEEERRKDKDTIAMMENRIVTLEGSFRAITQQNKDISGEVTRLAVVITRMDQHDANLLQLRVETKHLIEELDKDIKKREDEAEKVRRVEVKAIDNNVVEVRKELGAIPKLEKGILTCAEDDVRMRRSIDELREKIEGVRHEEEEYTRTFRILEDGRRQDAKRLTDLQGEVAALRKRVDDHRGQIEVGNTGLRKIETRLNELVLVEAERRDAMTAFIDKQVLTQVERDRVWKEWQTRFETIEKQAIDVEAQLVTLESTHREAKRVQVSLEELTQRVERRINEITEIQRLVEERFRQEWMTFKADDQKRWTNYTLTQEEQRNEVNRQYTKIIEQVTQLEDSLQEIQDLVHQVNELAEKRLQALLALAHDWVSTYERTMGRA